MELKKFMEFEAKRVLGRRYFIVALIFLSASFYFIQNGISQYKNIEKEKNNFQEFEATKSKYFVYMVQHGLYGVRMFFLPSPLMAIFNCGPVPDYMIAFYDSSERMKIYQPLIGQSAFSRITSVFMTFAGFILLFGSSMILIYGFTGSKDHEWLKFLEDSIGRGKLFIYHLNEMKNRISFFHNLSAIFPSTFFLSINNEMSSRGFSNLVKFNEYTQEKKKEFIWFIADHIILNNKNEFAPFFKENENIYQGQSRLPGNFNFGLAVTIIWIIVLLGLYWIRLNRMLDHVPKTDNDREFNKDDFKKNQTNVVITSDRSLYPKLLVKLRSQKATSVSIPGPKNLPGDFKVKDLLSLFGMAVPEKLQKKAGNYVYTLGMDDNARVIIEITRSFEKNTGIFIFDNFLSELSDDCIEEFTNLVKTFKKGRTLIYFTRSILTSTKIADYIHRFTKEKPSY